MIFCRAITNKVMAKDIQGRDTLDNIRQAQDTSKVNTIPQVKAILVNTHKARAMVQAWAMVQAKAILHLIILAEVNIQS